VEDAQKSPQIGKAKPTRVIDSKKGQNVGIFLKSSKLCLEGVEEIVYRLNYTGDLESLVTLRSFQASEEELGMLEHHTATQADQPLDLPDQFLLQISKLNSLDSRLACLQFKMGFSDRVDEVEMKIVNMRSCCNFLSTEPTLRKVLAVILSCGNYLNGGNAQRGQAEGFGIDILPKLKDLKTMSNTDNLMAFVVRFCIEKYDEDRGTPLAKLPVPEPGDLEKCRHVDFEVEKGVCAALAKEVTEMRRRVEKINECSPEDLKQPFLSIMSEFLLRADQAVKEVAGQVEDCAAKFIECMKSYKFMPKKGPVEEVKPEEFFLSWHLFAEDYKSIWKKEQRRTELELAKAARQEEMMKKTSVRASAAVETKKTPTGGLKDRISKRKSKSYSCMGKVKTSPEDAKKILLMVPELKTRAASENYM